MADGYFYAKGEEKPVAIELELSVKARSRLNSIVEDYGGNLSVSEVWYFCNDQSVKSALEKASFGYSFIKIFDLHDLSSIQGREQAHG